MEFERLQALLAHCWSLLAEGAASARSPLHTPVLGTLNGETPELRTVVLRQADRERRTILCHTDRRSSKVRQISASPPVSWLFYDPERKIQLRLAGCARIHLEGGLAERRWAETPAGSRRCYLVAPGPGEEIEAPASTLPETLRDRRPTVDETLPGRANFAVVTSEVEKIDWLYLTADGHRRAVFEWSDGGWSGRWVAP